MKRKAVLFAVAGVALVCLLVVSPGHRARCQKAAPIKGENDTLIRQTLRNTYGSGESAMKEADAEYRAFLDFARSRQAR